MVEAEAMRRALVMARNLVIKKAKVESDSQVFVKAINSKSSSIHWSCSAILDDILLLLNFSYVVSVNFVSKKVNSTVDWLAKKCC